MNNSTRWCQACASLCCLSIAVALLVAGFSGCGGGGKAKSETAGDKSAKPDDKKPGPGNPLIAGEDGGHRGVWTKDGQKFYNNTPYDVWYPNAFAVASDQTPVGSGGNGGGNKQPPGKGTKNPPMPKKSPAGSTDWKAIAPIAVLEAEVKRIRNELSQKTNTIGRYRGNYKQIAWDGATLAAVGQIISIHPDKDKVSWKDDALYVRDLGMTINESATGLGKKNFDKTRAAAEQFVDILNRNKPAGLKTPAKDAEFFDFAERAGMMKRMDAAFNWLQKEINNEEKFKSEGEQVIQEAAILALLVKCAGDKSYDQAAEKSYQQYVAKAVQATLDVRAAVQAKNFGNYRNAVNVIQNTCNECHVNHKNN